jgi:hypothetical protein
MCLQKVDLLVQVKILGAQQELILSFKEMGQVWQKVINLAVVAIAFDQDVSGHGAMRLTGHP